MSNYAIVDDQTGVVVNIIIWDGAGEFTPPAGCSVIASDTAQIGWRYADGVFTAPPAPEPTPYEIIAINTAKLQYETQLAAAQKTALSNRIGTINDAIELEMATPEEVAELPIRQAQLLEWKRYAIFLGRVTLQSGWALTVVWPDQPPEGMDLTVSAVAPDSPQLQ